MKASQEQIKAIAYLFESAADWVVRNSFFKSYRKQRHVSRTDSVTQFIDNRVTLFRWARMPRFISVRSNRLSMELNFCVRKVLSCYRVDLLIDPMDFTLEYCDSPQDKILILGSIRIARLVNVEQVHKPEEPRE